MIRIIMILSFTKATQMTILHTIVTNYMKTVIYQKILTQKFITILLDFTFIYLTTLMFSISYLNNNNCIWMDPDDCYIDLPYLKLPIDTAVLGTF